MATQTKPAPRTQEVSPPRQAVAVIQAPRLPYAPEFKDLYQIDVPEWRALVEAVWPNAKTTSAVALALSYCKKRSLDPFKRVVHIVPIWDAKAGENGKGAYVETVWPGIAEHRTTAMRTANYAGLDKPEYGPMVDRIFKGRSKKWENGQQIWEDEEVEVRFPEWCQITVWRMLHGQRVPFPGPRVYWLETYMRKNNFSEVPNAMWAKRANGQIEKCAEAAALRRAFPEELGDEWTIEEQGQIERVHGMQDVTHEGSATVAPAEPQRADYQAATAENAPPADEPPPEAEATSRPGSRAATAPTAPEPTPAKNWSVKTKEVNAAARAIGELLDIAQTPEDIGEILRQNAEIIPQLLEAGQETIKADAERLLEWMATEAAKGRI